MSTALYRPMRGPESLSPEWLAEHRRVLTATDMAAICGFSDYKQALDVYRDKKGLSEEFTGNQYTATGQIMEPAILKLYEMESGSKILNPLPMYYHADYSFLAATPDAAKVDEQHLTQETWDEGVEAKWTMSPRRASALGEEGSDFVPEDWMFQVQTQMAVMGWKQVDVAVLLYGRLKIYHCPRNERLIHGILSAAEEMWDRLAKNNPPEPNFQHPKTPDLIKAMYGLDEAQVVDLSEETATTWAKYQGLGESIKELERDREEAKARVLHAMGNAAIGWTPDNRQLIRSTVNRKEYLCKASSHVSLREKKAARK